MPLELLVDNLQHAFDRRSWHGPNLMGSLRGLQPDEASFRPQPERHNIWEYVVHAAYWKYRVVRLLDASSSEGFTYAGSNFFPRPVEATLAALKADIKVLRSWHGRLIEAVASTDPAILDQKTGSTEFTNRELILGAAAHDVYHAGQVRLIRRMWAEGSGRASA